MTVSAAAPATAASEALTPDTVLPHLPTQPRYTNRRVGSNSLIVDAHFDHTAAEIEVQPLDHHMFVFQIGRTTEFEQWRDGRSHATASWSQGDASLMPSGSASRWRWTVTTDTLHVYVPPVELARVGQQAFDIDGGGFEVINRFRFADPLLNAIGIGMLNELRCPEWLGALYLDTLAHAFVVHTLRSHVTARPRPVRASRLDAQALRRLQHHIDERLGEVVALADLAAVVHLSPFHFCRAFKAATGLPPHAYVMERRLARAKDLLLQTTLGIKQIAEATGFSDQGHLSRAFRRRFGRPPSAIRSAV